MLTKADFELFAEIIKNSKTKEDVIQNCCDYFIKINPRFKQDKFKEACK